MSQHSSPSMKRGRTSSWTPTQPLDRPAALRPERDATLDRGRAELGEERLVGLGRIGIIVLRARDPAAALEVAQDATVQEGGELDDVLIGQWGSFVEDRPCQRMGARVDAVEDEDVEMQIEIERAAEALGDDDRAGATALHTGSGRALARTREQRAHEDAPDGGTELGVEGQQIADAEGESLPLPVLIVAPAIGTPLGSSTSFIQKGMSFPDAISSVIACTSPAFRGGILAESDPAFCCLP